MSKRNWGYVFALGIALTVFWAWVTSAPPLVEYHAPGPVRETVGPFEACDPKTKDNDASDKESAAVKPVMPNTGPSSAACKEATKDAQTAQQDLEAQWRAAIAAENAVALGVRQNRWAVGEFLALIGTLFIAYMALADGRRHSVAELRAYVSLKDRKLNRFFIGQKPYVDFKIFNSGTTPAYNMRYRAALEVFDVPVRGDINRFFANVPGDVPPAFVVQSQEFTDAEAVKYEPMSVIEMAGVMSGAWGLYLVVVVEYDDAFGNERVTKFCAWVGGAGV